jgi:putative peptide zinc metalloprotease protein
MELNYIPELSDELEFSKISNSSYIVSSAQEKHYVKINQDTYNLILLIDGEKS